MSGEAPVSDPIPNLLGRDLTAEEQALRAALERAFDSSAILCNLGPALRQLVSRAPTAFCAAVLSVLPSLKDPVRRHLYESAAECREFWIELFRAGSFSRPQLLQVCRYFMTIENLLDVRLARLTSGRRCDDGQLDSETTVRILDLLDELSSGNRLILLLNHLTRHPDCRIAAKATLLVGRRLRNPDWVADHLDSKDGRVRASTVEGLWGSRSPATRNSLWASLNDKNNRVVGNALIGLHQIGEPGVNEFLKRMIEDSRPPFRWTAAWVMGQIGAEVFLEDLERALRDKEAHVQRAAERALEAILHRDSTDAAASPHSSGTDIETRQPSPLTPRDTAGT